MIDDDLTVFIGFDPREAACFAVARESIAMNSPVPVHVRGISLDLLRARGFYRRNHRVIDGRLWDVISEAPMTTEFAISRFIAPLVCQSRYAVFMDCDMMLRTNINRVLQFIDKRAAVSVVKHDHRPANTVKMDGQIQTTYSRKNWSSFMVFDCWHPANERLSLEILNGVPGRDLHAFCWLTDDEIGALPPEWNYLVGHTQLPRGTSPAVVHWTEGAPCMPGYEISEYADEFRKVLNRWSR